MEADTIVLLLMLFGLLIFFLIGVPVGAVSLVKFNRWYSNQFGAPSDEEWEGFLLIAGAIMSWFAFFFIAGALVVAFLNNATEHAVKIARRIP